MLSCVENTYATFRTGTRHYAQKKAELSYLRKFNIHCHKSTGEILEENEIRGLAKKLTLNIATGKQLARNVGVLAHKAKIVEQQVGAKISPIAKRYSTKRNKFKIYAIPKTHKYLSFHCERKTPFYNRYGRPQPFFNSFLKLND